MRRRLPSWHEDAPGLLISFHRDLAVSPQDPAMLALVDEMKKLSADFRRWWTKPAIEGYRWGISSIMNADLVRLDFDHEMLTVDEQRHLRMIVYFRAYV
jgi:hypothetical protein